MRDIRIIFRSEGTLQRFSYELYKKNWMLTHVSHEDIVQAYREYMLSMTDNPFALKEGFTFEQYIEDQGINGMIYVGFSEFVNHEYKDKEFMKQLLGEECYQAYTSYN